MTRMSEASSLLTSAPTLETPRLRLRAHTLANHAACTALWSNPDVARYTVGKPNTAEDAWSRILRYAGHWSLLGFGYWLVEERSTGAFVGEVGLADYHRNIPVTAGRASRSRLGALALDAGPRLCHRGSTRRTGLGADAHPLSRRGKLRHPSR